MAHNDLDFPVKFLRGVVLWVFGIIALFYVLFLAMHFLERD